MASERKALTEIYNLEQRLKAHQKVVYKTLQEKRLARKYKLLDEKLHTQESVINTLKGFEDYIGNQNTARNYTNRISTCEQYFNSIGKSIFYTPQDIKLREVNKLYHFLKSKKYKINTINQCRSALYKFNNYQFSLMKAPKLSRKSLFWTESNWPVDEVRTKPPTDEEMRVFKKMVKTLDTPTRLYIELLMFTGARISEFLRLRECDFRTLEDTPEFTELDVIFGSQTKRVNKFLIPREMACEILDNLAYSDTDKIPLFEFSVANISRHIKIIFNAMGVSDRYSAHSLRSYRIKEISKSGNILIAQQFVNHTNYRTTMRYIEADRNQVLEVLKAEKTDIS